MLVKYRGPFKTFNRCAHLITRAVPDVPDGQSLRFVQIVRRSNCNARAQRLEYACAPVSELTSFCAEKDHWQVDRQPASGGATVVFVRRVRVSLFIFRAFGFKS